MFTARLNKSETLILLQVYFGGVDGLSFGYYLQLRAMSEFQQHKPSPFSQHLINNHLASLNHLFETHNTSYQVINEFIQPSDGHLYYLHLVGQPDKCLFTVTFHVPREGHCKLVEYAKGHQPHQSGYGTKYDHCEPHFHIGSHEVKIQPEKHSHEHKLHH